MIMEYLVAHSADLIPALAVVDLGGRYVQTEAPKIVFVTPITEFDQELRGI